jgi:hypothetical protein
MTLASAQPYSSSTFPHLQYQLPYSATQFAPLPPLQVFPPQASSIFQLSTFSNSSKSPVLPSSQPSSFSQSTLSI